MPWKNGAGRTRILSTQAAEAGAGQFAWRVSIAELSGDADFSSFPGILRQQMLLQGTGFRLHGDQVQLELSHLYAQHAFSGEVSLQCTLLDGPCTVLNVMTDSHWQASMTAHQGGLSVSLQNGSHLLIAATGEHQLTLSGQAQQMAAGDILCISGDGDILQHQANQDSCLILVSFRAKGE